VPAAAKAQPADNAPSIISERAFRVLPSRYAALKWTPDVGPWIAEVKV
jgi:hypothetical protein